MEAVASTNRGLLVVVAQRQARDGFLRMASSAKRRPVAMRRIGRRISRSSRVADRSPVAVLAACDDDDAECGANLPPIRRFFAKWPELVPLRRSFPRILAFLKPQAPRILTAWSCAAVSVAALYAVVPQVGKMSCLLAAGDLAKVWKDAGLAIFLIAVRSLAQYFQQALLWEVALSLTCDVREYVFDTVMKKEMGYFEGHSGAAKGDIAYRISAEADHAGDTVYALLNMIVPCSLQLGAMAGRMVSLSPVLFVATVSILPSVSVVIAILGQRLRALSKKGQESVANLSAYLNEVLPCMLVVKACAAEAFEKRRFRRLALADLQAHLAKRKMKALIPEVITAVYATTGVVLFALGTWVVAKGRCKGNDMVAFITSLVLLIEPIQQMGKAYNEVKQGEPAVERLFDLASPTSKAGSQQAAGSVPVKNVAGNVTFINVTFSYGNDARTVLSDISLRVGAGETVALVGPSGGGKTTLAKLLLRLYDPVQGKIHIDGRDIRDFSLQSLRQRMGVVPQESVLFSGTVTENIAYGVMPEDIDAEKVERAAHLANADEFIRRLPNGYNTQLGERGSGLSGGQRQRLAIARAIYHEPSILILDEATSALDNKSEKLVRESLERLMIGRTVFIIAHRLETIRKADRILLLDGGKLVEEGTHSALLARGGQYAALFRTGDDDKRPQQLQPSQRI